MNRRISIFVALLVAALVGVACDDGETTSAPPTVDAAAALPAHLLVETEPEGALDVVAMRGTAKDGERVVVQGVIGGRAEPIAGDRAIFTLMDSSITTCETMEGDTCETPWDACCEPADVIAAGSTAVQVVDAAGRPLDKGLNGVGGLAPLKRVVVIGTYRASPDGKAATIDAERIYVAG